MNQQGNALAGRNAVQRMVEPGLNVMNASRYKTRP